MAKITLERVTKRFGDHVALDGVDLEIASNETTAIVGPSGSGKSTLLQLINGLVRPDAGKIHVFEEAIDYSRLPALRLRIGYAVQGTGLFPHMSVWKNITLLAEIAKWDARLTSERAAALMSQVGLDESLMGRYPFELSGGQQQRVGLCRAMMLNPNIFLLDEPFGALDPITRSEIHREFAKLQQSEPRTIVLVTHDLREALKLADQLVILDKGRVVQRGRGEDVLQHPASVFVRRLFEAQLETFEIGGGRE